MMFKGKELKEYIKTEIQICSKCSWGDDELLQLKSNIQDRIQNEEEAHFEICPSCGSSTTWIEVRTSQ